MAETLAPVADFDFTCGKCGVPTIIAPPPPERAICPTCCGETELGHEFAYVRGYRRYECEHCGVEPSPDWHGYHFD